MLSRELSHSFLPEDLFSDPRVSEKGLHILSEDLRNVWIHPREYSVLSGSIREAP